MTKKERDLYCQGSWLRERWRLNPEDSTFLSVDIEAHGHNWRLSQVVRALASHGRATKPHNDECRERIRTTIEKNLDGKAYKDRTAETEGVKERKRARV